MKIAPFYYFLKAPVLKLPAAQFPFAPFATSESKPSSFELDFPSQLMLGKQAEAIFESWLQHSQRFQILGANIQIQGAQETLGELDYIVQDTESDAILHIELACKFYLLDETLSQHISGQWIGPNRKDRLVDKLTKMKTKQFPLLDCEETALALSKFQVDIAAVQQQYCLKAFLFVPKRFQQDKLPKYFQECLAGFSIHWTELDSEKDETALYALPQKKEWLLPQENLTNWVPFSKAKEAIKISIAEKRSPLVYKKTQGLLEKFFVVWW